MKLLSAYLFAFLIALTTIGVSSHIALDYVFNSADSIGALPVQIDFLAPSNAKSKKITPVFAALRHQTQSLQNSKISSEFNDHSYYLPTYPLIRPREYFLII